uniref:CS domain-containing protein n=1 Tax=Heterorhabditis bacteriophora TaxID=37862 RepID=A0A1I7XIR1_HETBA
MACSSSQRNFDSVPGPLGCRYDDSLTELEIQLVVPGIREKSIMKASNTQVFLKSDNSSMSCTIEIVKVDKKQKPPVKTIVDRRFFEVQEFPGDIVDVSFKLKKDCCVLTVRKKTPQSWANQMSQLGF